MNTKTTMPETAGGGSDWEPHFPEVPCPRLLPTSLQPTISKWVISLLRGGLLARTGVSTGLRTGKMRCPSPVREVSGGAGSPWMSPRPTTDRKRERRCAPPESGLGLCAARRTTLPRQQHLRSLVPPLPRFPLASNATDYDERGVYRYRMADDTAAAARPSPRGQLRLHRQIVTLGSVSRRCTPAGAERCLKHCLLGKWLMLRHLPSHSVCCRSCSFWAAQLPESSHVAL